LVKKEIPDGGWLQYSVQRVAGDATWRRERVFSQRHWGSAWLLIWGYVEMRHDAFPGGGFESFKVPKAGCVGEQMAACFNGIEGMPVLLSNRLAVAYGDA